MSGRAAGAWGKGRPEAAGSTVEVAITSLVVDEAKETEREAVVLLFNIQFHSKDNIK